MTEATSTPEADATPGMSTGGPSGLAKTVMGTIAIAVVFAPLILMWAMPDRLTPDIAYRWMSTDDGKLAMTLAATLALVLGVGVAVSYEFTEKNIFAEILAMVAGWYALVYVMGVCVETLDRTGASNPYVRAQQATPEQFRTLALVRRYPTVAAEMRRAAADGRVTKGEAHDIVEGTVLAEARTEEAERRAARDRAAVLSK